MSSSSTSRYTREWDRLPGESPEAFEAFAAYRDMRYDVDYQGKRAYRKVAQKLGKSETLISRWGSRWNWQTRVESYDAHMDAVAQEEIERGHRGEVREMMGRHASISSTILYVVYVKVQKWLENPEDVKMSNADIATFLKVSAELERMSRDLPSNIIEQRPSELPNPDTVRQVADELRKYMNDYSKPTSES